MTTYFTPVGTLAELTRAKGSDINARETAVESGFTAIEAVMAVTNGTSSIVYATGWQNYTGGGSATSLKKTLSTCVILNLSAQMFSGAAGSIITTLPVGYRPASKIDVVGMMYDFSASAYFSAYFEIYSNGQLNVAGINGTSSTIVPALNDTVFLTVTFFTT